MRDLQELVRATKEFATEDEARTWRLLLTTLVIFGVALVGTWPLGGQLPIWARLGSSVFLGLVTVRIFIFYHDALHGALFQRPGISSSIGRGILAIFGVLTLNPPNIWNRSHNYHHKSNSQIVSASIGSFPIMTKADYLRANWRVRLGYRAARHPLTILFGYPLIFVVGMCGKSFVTDPRRHWDSALALVIHAALILGLIRWGGPEQAVLSLVLPLALSCALGAYLFYVQHNFPDMQLKPREQWDYLSAALKASSFMEGSAFVHWFTGNIGYHHVHHLNHRIPFYRLPEAMRAIPELQAPGRTSLKPSDVWRALKLKVWDVEAGRMVGL